MQALKAGGIELFYSKRREARMQATNKDDYEVNPYFYEVGQSKYMNLGFTTDLPDNIAVKIQAIGLPIIAANRNYKIIYMRRDPEAIKQSFIAAFSEQDFKNNYSDWPNHYYQLLDGVKAIMKQRGDVELLELCYDDVILDPMNAMIKIKQMGINIDVDKAVSVVDATKRRYAA